MMRIYMAVTADKYELPLGVYDNAQDMADAYGTTRATCYHCIWSGRKHRKKFRFVKVEVEE